MSSLILLSISLAMDAFSVSITGGIKSKNAKLLQAIKVSSFFGFFQALMPVIGWLIGEFMEKYITTIDHWIAFILLVILGIKMIKEALNSDSSEVNNILDTRTLLLLSIATSIDALIAGITLSLIETPFFVSIIVIGLVTFLLSFLGFVFGKRLGNIFGKKVEILGGIALILIGLRILFSHLY